MHEIKTRIKLSVVNDDTIVNSLECTNIVTEEGLRVLLYGGFSAILEVGSGRQVVSPSLTQLHTKKQQATGTWTRTVTNAYDKDTNKVTNVSRLYTVFPPETTNVAYSEIGIQSKTTANGLATYALLKNALGAETSITLLVGEFLVVEYFVESTHIYMPDPEEFTRSVIMYRAPSVYDSPEVVNISEVYALTALDARIKDGEAPLSITRITKASATKSGRSLTVNIQPQAIPSNITTIYGVYLVSSYYTILIMDPASLPIIDEASSFNVATEIQYGDPA